MTAISYADVVENFWITHLASNQIIEIGQSSIIRFGYFPIESEIMDWKKELLQCEAATKAIKT